MAQDSRLSERDLQQETLWDAFQRQTRIIGALILRETRTRFGTSRLGYLWALAEPVLHIAVLSTLYIVLLRHPLAGNSITLFFTSGIIGYFLFQKTSQQLAGAISANRALLHLAMVKNADVIFARALLELATILVVAILLATFLYAFDQFGNTSIDLMVLFKAVALLWLVGVGVGFINAVLGTLVKSWHSIYSIATRPLYLLSGVFFLAEKMPPQLARVASYNPILHGIEYLRSGIYPGYGRTFVDLWYLVGWAFIPLVLGMALLRLMRRELSAKVGTG